MIDQFFIEVLMNCYFAGIGTLGFYFVLREIFYLRKEAKQREKRTQTESPSK